MGLQLNSIAVATSHRSVCGPAPALTPTSEMDREQDRTGRAAEVQFVLFGGVRIVRAGVEIEVTQPKQRGLLALLLANVGEVVSVGSIVDALWAGEPAATAVNQLHRHVGALRRACEPGLGRRQSGQFILGSGHGYRIAVDPDTSDLVRFRQLATQARELGDVGDQANALRLSLRALAVAASPAADEDFQDLPEFASVEDERIAAIVTAVKQCRYAADYAALLPALRSASERHPYDESLAANLVDVLSRTGRSAEAVRLYRAVRQRLHDELGCEPGSGLKRALAAALRADSTPPEEARVDSTGTVPPRGRLPVPLPGFVGRRHMLATLAESAEQREILLLAGAGGVGKTALAVRHATQIAGRYPDGQLYVDLGGHDPGREPISTLDALADMLAGLNVPAHATPRGANERSRLLRSILSSQRLLVLLDDAHDFAQIEKLLPGSGPAGVIVTSRHPLPELVARHGVELVEVRSVDDELLDLLARRSASSRDSRDLADTAP
ncbi:BTAD domain-containing putative transcriptional regulator [uncultured Jatrophihabitans sp.]|uniref:AfsR/SARP family transcriptional regulator n=1 Tax=uncultured Jatrophihabitans sp. TaxID=1610747 RepID=UPI0035CB1577